MPLRTARGPRVTLRRRADELAVYTAITVGLLLLGERPFDEFPEFGATYGEARYLLPLLPLLDAARAGGRRWEPIIGTRVVVLALFHDIFSQLQVIARYYY